MNYLNSNIIKTVSYVNVTGKKQKESPLWYKNIIEGFLFFILK